MTDAAKPLKPRETSPATSADVDRMIGLGRERKKTELPPPDSEDSLDQPKDRSLWKIFLQLRPFLPYLARLVPALDVALGPLQTAGASHEVRQSIAESTAKIQSIQRDLTAAVTSAVDQQAVQFKRVEEEMIRLRETAEIQVRAQTVLAEDLRSLMRLVRYAVISGAVLLVALIAMSALLLTQGAAR